MLINGVEISLNEIKKIQEDIFAEANNKNFDKAALEICREKVK